MEKIMEKNILIRDIETKNIMTKSSLPVGGYSVNPYVGCTRLQILLCLFYETVHRAYRIVGNISGYKTLAGN